MGRPVQPAAAKKRPPGKEDAANDKMTTKLKGYRQEDIEKANRYIDKVRNTGIHWLHHIERLEKKYNSNVVKVYHELVDNVKANNKKKQDRKQGKLDKVAKKHARPPPSSSADSSNSGSTSSSSGSSGASGQTFSSAGVTQAMFEKERGRPKKLLAKPSNLSQQSNIHTETAHRGQPEADSARFSLSDDGSSAPDWQVTNDISFNTNSDVPDLQAAADFWDELPPPLSKQHSKRAAEVSTESSQTKKKPKYDKAKQPRLTEASSQEDSQSQRRLPLRPISESKVSHQDDSQKIKRSSKVASKIKAASSASVNENRPSTSKKGKATTYEAPTSGDKTPEEPCSSAVTISSAIDELLSGPEDAGVSSNFASTRFDKSSESQNAPESSQERPRKSLNKRKKRVQAAHSDEQATTSALTTSTPALQDGRPNKISKTDVAPWNAHAEMVDNEVMQAQGVSATGVNTAASATDSEVQRIFSAFFPSAQAEINRPQIPEQLAAPSIDTTSAPPVPEPFVTPDAATSHVGPSNGAGGVPQGIGLPSNGQGQIVAAPFNNLPQLAAPAMALPVAGPSTAPFNAFQHQPPNVPEPAQTVQTGHNQYYHDQGQQGYAPQVLQRHGFAIDDLNPGQQDISIKDFKINEGLAKCMLELGFETISDFAKNDMGKEEIRLFIAAIADEIKLKKSETLAAIFKISAAVLRYQEGKAKVAGIQ
ncbi:hypothetical protein P389DRAFT_210022 [Cystobasidium minutum MCA 4210]|uniref:uncharacterized protein n=1 Tax=Cystobasidium minutum MCA 4210 TaxID=1397322 RepID=UPI0034CFF31E|eukprot:jgi/Rhomi1/210022/estExt_Genemark1.C_3_t20221